MRKIFINENIDVFEYDAAEPFLKERNDLAYFNEEEQGIHKVSKERWKIAQEYERLTWMERNPYTKDDRNLDHFEKFESFKSIQQELKTKKSAIELGCGAFTNMRLFVDLLDSPHITLLDPLIHSYINLQHCPYSNGKIGEHKVTLISSSIEEFTPANHTYETPGKYDVVIMMNVIEHCFDVDSIFNKILSIMNENSLLIFADVYFHDVKTKAENIYDAGHPLSLSELKLNKFLENFTTLFDQRYHGLFGQDWRNDIYFIGRK